MTQKWMKTYGNLEIAMTFTSLSSFFNSYRSNTINTINTRYLKINRFSPILDYQLSQLPYIAMLTRSQHEDVPRATGPSRRCCALPLRRTMPSRYGPSLPRGDPVSLCWWWLQFRGIPSYSMVNAWFMVI